MAQATAIQQLLVKVPELLPGESEERIGRVLCTIVLRLPEPSARAFLSLKPYVLTAALLHMAGGCATGHKA